MGSQQRLKVFTWHVHGSYLYYLTQSDIDFYIPTGLADQFGYGGRAGPFPWGDNLHEVPVEHIPHQSFDLILFQARQHYEVDQHRIFSPAQLQLPKVYLEHDPPREHPTDTRHIVSDPSVTLVHVTDFNRLMWDSNGVPTAVIDHGVVDAGYQYQGTLERGVVVINNLRLRGRRLGADIFQHIRHAIPLDLIGMGADELDGVGEVPHNELPAFIAQYRFFFNPIRYTSLGLSILEAMMVGLPIVGLQTTELVSVIASGENGYLSLKTETLIEQMRKLLDQPQHAQQLGQNARATALERFSIARFTRDWENLFLRVCQRSEEMRQTA